MRYLLAILLLAGCVHYPEMRCVKDDRGICAPVVSESLDTGYILTSKPYEKQPRCVYREEDRQLVRYCY